jgi:hypothetical protein
LNTISERIITEKLENKSDSFDKSPSRADLNSNNFQYDKPEADKYYIDATKVIQMIEEKEKQNLEFKEIDEILLRQRIERELRYEFNQMQIEHEKKMKIIYRKMIENMYREFLNS